MSNAELKRALAGVAGLIVLCIVAVWTEHLALFWVLASITLVIQASFIFFKNPFGLIKFVMKLVRDWRSERKRERDATLELCKHPEDPHWHQLSNEKTETATTVQGILVLIGLAWWILLGVGITLIVVAFNFVEGPWIPTIGSLGLICSLASWLLVKPLKRADDAIDALEDKQNGNHHQTEHTSKGELTKAVTVQNALRWIGETWGGWLGFGIALVILAIALPWLTDSWPWVKIGLAGVTLMLAGIFLIRPLENAAQYALSALSDAIKAKGGGHGH